MSPLARWQSTRLKKLALSFSSNGNASVQQTSSPLVWQRAVTCALRVFWKYTLREECRGKRQLESLSENDSTASESAGKHFTWWLPLRTSSHGPNSVTDRDYNLFSEIRETEWYRPLTKDLHRWINCETGESTVLELHLRRRYWSCSTLLSCAPLVRLFGMGHFEAHKGVAF